MNLALTTEQEQIGRALDHLLVNELPLSRVRELAAHVGDRAIDDETWQVCASAGWLGGAGLGAVDESLLFQRLGRHLAPGPFRATVVAGHAAAAVGDDALAAALASGARRCGWLVGDLALDLHPGDLAVRVTESGAVVFDGCDVILIDGVDDGVRLGVAAGGTTVVSAAGDAFAARSRLHAAAEALGVIEAVRDMSASYARVRVQFDTPIGAFQAVKHRCADMAINAYALEAQVRFAAQCVDQGHPDAAFHAAAAYLFAIRAARVACADNIQNHGAIGFTLEHDAHLFLRRAHTLEWLFGRPSVTRDAVLAPARHEFR